MRHSYLRRFVCFSLAIVLLALPVLAAGSAYGTVTASNLRFRAEPSPSAQILATIPGGTNVTILDTTPVSNSSGDWYKAEYKNSTGYVSADYIKISDAIGTTCGITPDRLNLRSGPSTASPVLTVLSKGVTITILGSDADGWRKVKYKSTEGYVKSEFLDIANSGSTSDNVSGKYGQVTASRVNFRSAASLTSSVKSVLSLGTVVNLTGTEDDWYSATYNGTKGYVHSDYIKVTSEKPSNDKSNSKTSSDAYDEGIDALTSSEASDMQSAIVETALSKLGRPYVYGANGPNSFDCSGFTSWVYRQCGISINRTAVDQYRLNGKKVSSVSSLKPGDLVFVRDPKVSSNVVTHVGIYIGQGKMVHAGSGNSDGGRGVKVSSLKSGYYSKIFVCGKRVVS